MVLTHCPYPAPPLTGSWRCPQESCPPQSALYVLGLGSCTPQAPALASQCHPEQSLAPSYHEMGPSQRERRPFTWMLMQGGQPRLLARGPGSTPNPCPNLLWSVSISSISHPIGGSPRDKVRKREFWSHTWRKGILAARGAGKCQTTSASTRTPGGGLWAGRGGVCSARGQSPLPGPPGLKAFLPLPSVFPGF